MTTVRIPTPLRSFTGGAGEVTVAATTVGGALDALGAGHDGILGRVLDDEGRIRPFVNVFVGYVDYQQFCSAPSVGAATSNRADASVRTKA